MENTSIRWFLGANSRRGFASLYRGFPPEGAYLHIIKGGPGTGKSSLMRRIAAAARSAGLGVEYILCSGDPDSLDAVYIPELGAAWADGTAPHALEPEVFGADGAYLDTSQCCSQARLRSGADELCRLGADIRVEGRVAVVCGVERLTGAAMECTDLRGGAAMVVGALAAEGESRIGSIRHIQRGYEDILRDLRLLGAQAEER